MYVKEQTCPLRASDMVISNNSSYLLQKSKELNVKFHITENHNRLELFYRDIEVMLIQNYLKDNTQQSGSNRVLSDKKISQS